MQVNVAGLRRNIKNLAHNYSDAQVKVREATSNDPWGPSATIMAEIADLTYNVVAFSEIMQMIWKRLNDHGKNWRHVYKALILLEYLIKTGTEKVSQQCKENIYAIQTLREFVYFEEGKDQGTHVREKAKQLVVLLKDDERLKNERIKALKAKERFAQHPSGFGSDGYIDGPLPRDLPPGWQEEPTKPVSDLEMVRPQTAGEEELQLQLAMAMSREEAEQEEAKRRSDDVRLQLALSQSEQDFKQQKEPREEQQSHLLDLLDISLGATSISSPPLGATSDPWGTPARAASQLSDPWTGSASPPIDPWQPSSSARNSALGAVGMPVSNGGGVSGIADTWAGVRTQSPSVTSGSSNEGWLQSNGTNGNVPHPPAAGKADPWETKSGSAGAPVSTDSTDPWLGTNNAKSVIAVTAAQSVTEKTTLTLSDPWAPKHPSSSTDPWKNVDNIAAKKPSPDLDEFDVISNRKKSGAPDSNENTNNNNALLLLEDLDPLSATNTSAAAAACGAKKPFKDPQAFLGENSALVNLDNLIKPVAPHAVGGSAAAYNPFSDTAVIPPKANLFQQQQPPVPSINQLKQQQPFAMTMNPDPWAPVANTNMTTPQINCYDNLNNNKGLLQSNAHSPRGHLSYNPQNMMHSRSDYDAFQASHIFNTSMFGANSTTNHHQIIDNGDNHSQRLTQSIDNMRNITLADDRSDDLWFSNKPASQFSYPSLYPQVKIINNAENRNVKENALTSQHSLQSPLPLPPPPHPLQRPQILPFNVRPQFFTNNHTCNQPLGSANVPPPTSTSTVPLFPKPPITTAATTGTTATFQSRPAENVTTPSPFVCNYSNELQASLATTPGVIVKPLKEAEPLDANQYNTNAFSYGFYNNNDNNNANNYNSTTQCKLENNNNMPWMKPEAGASNPFLS